MDSTMLCHSIKKIYSYENFKDLIGKEVHLGGSQTQGACLTFDDGPSPHTCSFLHLLKKHNIKATFFMLGERVAQYPEVARAVVEQGHIIAVHGFRHTIATMMSAAEFYDSIKRFEELMDSLDIPVSKLYRPPQGEIDKEKVAILKKLGYTIVLWSCDSFDWKLSSSEMVNNFLRLDSLQQTFLFHDSEVCAGSRWSTMKAVAKLILLCGKQKVDFVRCKISVLPESLVVANHS